MFIPLKMVLISIDPYPNWFLSISMATPSLIHLGSIPISSQAPQSSNMAGKILELGKHVPAMSDIKGYELSPMSKCPCLPKEPRSHEVVGPCLLVKLNPHLLWNMNMWLPPISTASHQCSWQFPFAGWNGWIRQCLHLDLVTWKKSAWFPEVLDHYPLVI